MHRLKTVLTLFLITFTCQLFSLQPSWAAERYITCSSIDSRYNFCRINTDNIVRMSRQYSSRDCIEGRTWGYDAQGVWVDRGCRAEFVVGYPGYDNNSNNRPGYNEDYDRRPPEVRPPVPTPPPPVVPRWAVGNFRGKNMRDHSNASISISPNGEVTAVWGGQPHRGFFDGHNLQLGNLNLAVERYGQGFITILRTDPGNRVEFRRVP